MDFKVDIKRDYRGDIREYFWKSKLVIWTKCEVRVLTTRSTSPNLPLRD